MIKYDEKLIKNVAKDRGITISSKEAKEAHDRTIEELDDEEDYYYRLKEYFNN